MITGSCLCGKVTYRVKHDVRGIVHCHCRSCRKAHSSAFSTVTSVPADQFEISGDSNLNSYESSPGKHRFFCSTCGAQIYAQRTNKNNIILRVGSIDTTSTPMKELAHTWISEGAQWYDIDSQLPRYDGRYLPAT